MSKRTFSAMRGPIPSGKAGLILLAAAAVPVIITAFKPLAKAVSKGLIAAGEALREVAEEQSKPSKAEKKAAAPPKATASTAKAPEAPKKAPVATKVKQAKPPKKAARAKSAKKSRAVKAPRVAQKSAPVASTATGRRRRSVPADIETG